jgi:hypothetical protein
MAFKHYIFESDATKEKRLCLEALQALERYLKAIGYYTDEEIEAAAQNPDYLYGAFEENLLAVFCQLDFEYSRLVYDEEHKTGNFEETV